MKAHTLLFISQIRAQALFFKQNYHTSFITSFFRHFASKSKNKRTTTLKFKEPSETYIDSGVKFGRLFGVWKCTNCNNNSWSSAYSWISTEFCFNNNNIILVKSRKGLNKLEEEWFSGSKLKDNEFLLQKCVHCCENSDVKIVRYRNLEWKGEPESIEPHKEDLCIKCIKGVKCVKRY